MALKEQMIAGVYRIQNSVSGKFYIGSSKNIRTRILQHKATLKRGKHQNQHLQNSWTKYGESAFAFTTVLICAPEQVRFYEQLLLDGLLPEYNQTTSAFSGIPIGSVLTEEHKAKVKKASKQLWQLPEYREKVTNAINAAMTTSERQLRSERTTKLWANPEYRELSVAVRKDHSWNKGYRCTPAQVENRKKAARISNMKRNYGEDWKKEYEKRYPEYIGDLNG